jgi:tetratricopeptide (TPR) repeat protein
MPNPAAYSVWTTIMRFTPAAVATALIFATLSSTSMSAPARPAPISELSRQMEAEGRRLQTAGELEGAIGYFETALVADPRNAAAYIGLGEIARVQDMPGKAIGYFREALALAPEDRTALVGQGEAMVQRGALDKARQNLTRLQTLCGQVACAEATRLTAAITAAGARTALRTEEVMPQPVIEAAPQASN